MTTKKEARYLSDVQTLESQNKTEGIFTEQDLKILNILPENYKKWKEEYDSDRKNISAEVLEKFKRPTLLEEIKEELDKDHLKDDNVKMTVFLTAVSGLLKDSKKRMSMALTGDSSVGKDNVVKTSLKHMPHNSWLFLTGATQPAIEDEAIYVPILALSEMNLFRELGANKPLLEVVKQRTEGGTSSLKKDRLTGYVKTKHEKTEQGTTFYCTTDAERNAESETRFIFGNVGADEAKIRIVNEDTIKKHQDPKKIIQTVKEQDSWIQQGLVNLSEKYKDYNIIIPYADVLLEKIKGEDIIDHSSPRSMRDVKRLLALTTATTFLFSEQREKVDYGEHSFIISEPEDLINTLTYAREFFNTTYEGMDERLNKVLKILDSSVDGWVARDAIQRELKISVNTIKSWQETLESQGLIEWIKGADLNYRLESKTYDGNRIYLKRCQKGVRRLLIRCQIFELKKLLEERKVSVIDRQGVNPCVNKGINLKQGYKEGEKQPISSEIDTFSLTPLEKKEDFT